MKTMKVIDLYNEIASGTPAKKVKYNSYVFEHTNSVHDYYYYDNYKGIGRWLFDEAKDLNEEVEIIEDTPKKIEKIDISNFPKRNNSLKKTALKVNEIIDKINGE